MRVLGLTVERFNPRFKPTFRVLLGRDYWTSGPRVIYFWTNPKVWEIRKPPDGTYNGRAVRRYYLGPIGIHWVIRRNRAHAFARVDRLRLIVNLKSLRDIRVWEHEHVTGWLSSSEFSDSLVLRVGPRDPVVRFGQGAGPWQDRQRVFFTVGLHLHRAAWCLGRGCLDDLPVRYVQFGPVEIQTLDR